MGAAAEGDFVTALHHVTQAIERERSLANDPLLCRLLLLRGTFYELVDEVDSASEDLQEALGLARRPEDIVVVAQCRSGLARADLREARSVTPSGGWVRHCPSCAPPGRRGCCAPR
ncbi:hypothetical protein E4K10_48185 [Streptomyces sp. T1317-0309]|nr:hypothetical protein E4K10_48185 [Streptomyces sp. T1317-0309]